jgi:hypothetical protein
VTLHALIHEPLFTSLNSTQTLSNISYANAANVICNMKHKPKLLLTMLPTFSNEIPILLRNQTGIQSSSILYSFDNLGLSRMSRKFIVEAPP